MGKITSKNQKKPKSAQAQKKTKITIRKPKLKIEISAGGVVFRRQEKDIYILLIKDPYNHWALPKGKIEESETIENTARREILEETGLQNLKTLDKLGTIRYFFTFSGQSIFKIVHNFLFLTNEKKLSPSHEIKDARWFLLKGALRKITYKNTRIILEKAKDRILGEK